MNTFSRRGFLRSVGLGGLTLPAWFPRVAFSAAPSSERDVLVCLFLRGGADALNVVVPFGEDEYFARRPRLAMREPGNGAYAVLDIDGFFGFHPFLAPLKELYDDGVLAVVHAAGSPDRTHSHFDAMDFMERGTPGSKSIPTGWIGRHLATLDTGNDSPFRAVGMGTILQASLRGPVPVTALRSISSFHLEGRPGQAAEIARFQARLSAMYAGDGWLDSQARQTFDTVAALATARPGSHQPANGAEYPDTECGMALMQVAQLIKADVGLEVACVDLGGWDSHSGQGRIEGEMANAITELGRGLAAFHADLGDRMRRTTVVTMSEFGRRVKENSSVGTDHGHGGFMFLLGGKVNGGRIHGTWPGLSADQLLWPGDLAITTDYRTVLAEVLERRMGNARVGEVFPGFTAPGYLGVVR
ncbi:MAG TPA: DUF1501 domain-containing protein [Thermoanaerobaculia bacterium]